MATEPKPPLEGVKWALQTLAMPIALVSLPLLYQWKASEISGRAAAENQRREAAEQQFRLYTDLMSKREEADTTVRRGLFDKLVGSYLDPKPGDVDKRLVALELLSLNFHDTLNLSPLFWELDRQIAQRPKGQASDEYRLQLDRIASQVKNRQASALEVDGARSTMQVDLQFVGEGLAPQSRTFKLRNVAPEPAPDVPAEREFSVTVLSHDPAHRRLLVAVNWGGTADGSATQSTSFWVDPYDFPLTNFSRVSRSERFSLVLDRYRPTDEGGSARLVLLVFPSTRSGAKDRPYIDDLMARLAQSAPPAASAPTAASGAASPGSR
jgi:hypothetical protein